MMTLTGLNSCTNDEADEGLETLTPENPEENAGHSQGTNSISHTLGR